MENVKNKQWQSIKYPTTTKKKKLISEYFYIFATQLSYHKNSFNTFILIAISIVFGFTMKIILS